MLSDADKAFLSSQFSEAMNSFLVPLTVYVEAERVIVSEDPNYNRFNPVDQNAVTIEYQPNRYIVSGRLLFGDRQRYPYANIADEQLKLRNPEGDLRIKVDISGAAVLAASKQLEYRGDLFTLDSTPRPHGLFSGTYKTFYYKKVI